MSTAAEEKSLHLEWDSDRSTDRCVLCAARWTLTNRRHHCRNCGRLVCRNCSNNFLKLKQVYNGGGKGSSSIGAASSGGLGLGLGYGRQNDGDFDSGINRMSMVSVPEIDGMDNRSSVASKKAGKRGSGDDKLKAQRVCDGCYRALSVKKNRHLERNLQKERELLLLSSTSFVSESLVKVFLLDCSFKTICYDDTMTADDICTLLCYSVKIALFEVERDLKDQEQYRMIQPSELIVDVIHRWTYNQLNYAKLVLPLYDLEACKTTHNPPLLSVSNVSPSKAGNSTKTGDSKARSSSKSAVATAPAAPSLYPCVIEAPLGGPADPPFLRSSTIVAMSSLADNLDEDTNRRTIYESTRVAASASAGVFNALTECNVEVLRVNYIDLQRKHTLLKTIFTKKQSKRVSDEAASDNGGGAAATRIAHSNSISASQAEKFAAEISGNAEPAGLRIASASRTVASASLGSSAGQNSLFMKYTRSNNIISSSPYIRVDNNVANEGRSNNGIKGYDSHADLSSFDAKLIEEIRGSTFGDTSESPKRALYASNNYNAVDNPSSSIGVVNNNVNYSPLSDKSVPRQRSALSADLHDIKGLTLGRDDILSIFDGALLTSTSNNNNNNGNNAVGGDAAAAIAADGEVDLLAKFPRVVKTFFYQVYGIEAFCQKFDKYLHQFVTASAESANQSRGQLSGVAKSRSLLHDSEADSGATSGATSGASTDPTVVAEIYEMAITLQNLYEFILRYSENWSHMIKTWLLELLKAELDKAVLSANTSGSFIRSGEANIGGGMPRWDGKVLAAVVSCLDRESLLSDSEVVKIVSDAIDSLLNFLDTVGGKTKSIAQFLRILEQINLALMTVSELCLLFPPEANVINIFNLRVSQLISSSIVPFYLSRKHDLSTQDLLKFLNFTDLQVQVLDRFDVDASMCIDLNGEIVRQLMTAVSKAWRSLLSKLEEEEEVVFLPQRSATGDLSTKSSSGLQRLQGAHSPWPGELSRQLDEVMLLGKDKLVDFALETIRDFISARQSAYVSRFKVLSTSVLSSLDDEAASGVIASLCACVNNHFHFSDMLAERKEAIVAGRTTGLSGDGSRLLDTFTLLISIGAQQQSAAAAALAVALCNETREAIKASFAKEWDVVSNVSLVVHKRYNACSKVMVSLYHMMLKVDELLVCYLQKPLYNSFVKIIFANVVKCIVDSYVDNLVLRDNSTSIVVNNATFEKISGDLLIINYTIEVLNEKYGFGSISPTIVNPLSDVVALLKINARMIADFAVDNIGKYFAPAQVLKIVQNVLIMRNEGKNIADAVILAVGSNTGNSVGRISSLKR